MQLTVCQWQAFTPTYAGAIEAPTPEALSMLPRYVRTKEVLEAFEKCTESRGFDTQEEERTTVVGWYNYFETLKSKSILTESQVQKILTLRSSPYKDWIEQETDDRYFRIRQYRYLLSRWTIQRVHPLMSNGEIPEDATIEYVEKTIESGWNPEPWSWPMSELCNFANNLTYTAARCLFAMTMADQQEHGTPKDGNLYIACSLAHKIIKQARKDESDPSRKGLYDYDTWLGRNSRQSTEAVQAMSDAIFEHGKQFTAKFDSPISFETTPTWYFDFRYLRRKSPEHPVPPDVLTVNTSAPLLSDVLAPTSLNLPRAPSLDSDLRSNGLSEILARFVPDPPEPAESPLPASFHEADNVGSKSNGNQRTTLTLQGRAAVALSDGSVSLVAGKESSTQKTVLSIEYEAKNIALSIELSLEDLPKIENWINVCKMRFCPDELNTTSQ